MSGRRARVAWPLAGAVTFTISVSLAGCATAPAGGPSDRERIQAVVAGISHEIDGKRWPELRSLFADQVEVDYTSLFGGSPQRQAGDALIGGWRTALASVSTQHLFGPIDVEISEASATAQCHVRAWHRARGAPGGEEWVVGGHYRFVLGRAGGAWKITGMKLETLQQTGNTRLLQEAAAPK